MNELMQQTLAGLPAHDRRLVREIRPLVDDARRIGAEMDVAAALGACDAPAWLTWIRGNRQGPLRFPAVLSIPVSHLAYPSTAVTT